MSLATEQKQQTGRQRQQKTQAKQNQNNISDLTSEFTALQEKLVEQAKKIKEFEANIEDQVNRNSTYMLVIRGIKKENHEKTWNNASHLSSSLYGLFGQNPNQFPSDTERAHRNDYKNPN